MAESASYARRTHKGGCVATTIPAGLNSGATTATLADASTWAGGVANGNTRAMINRTGATPEEIEISGISGNDITIAARGLRGTSDVTHAAGVSIEIVSSPRDFDEANFAVSETVGKVTAAGDLLYADGANSLERLAKGTARQQLAMNSGATAPEWVASLQSLLTAQGDIVYASAANTPARLAKGTASQVLTMNAGATAPEWATAGGSTFEGAAVYRSTAQSISDAVETALSFDTERFDSGSVWAIGNPTRLVAATTGKFLASAAAGLNQPITPVQFYLVAYVNGSAVTGTRTQGAIDRAGGGFDGVVISVPLNLTAGDYVEFFLFQDSNGSVNTIAATTHGSLVKVGS